MAPWSLKLYSSWILPPDFPCPHLEKRSSVSLEENAAAHSPTIRGVTLITSSWLGLREDPAVSASHSRIEGSCFCLPPSLLLQDAAEFIPILTWQPRCSK